MIPDSGGWSLTGWSMHNPRRKAPPQCTVQAFESFLPSTYNHGPQHRDESAESAAFLDQRFAHSLLFRFFQQQILIVDILEGAVQLRLDVTSPWEQNKATRSACQMPASRKTFPFLMSLLRRRQPFSRT